MDKEYQKIMLEVQATNKKCPIGETTGKDNILKGKVPVLSCEGACIRGEIARLAASYVCKDEGYARACHGELFSVPNSAMAQWVKKAQKVVLIDGCFLRCHGRILENLVDAEKLIQFDALSYYKKYTDKFDINSVALLERKEVACDVAGWVLDKLGDLPK